MMETAGDGDADVHKTIEKLPHQNMTPPPLYKLNANLKRLTKTRLAARLPAFDTAMEPIIRAILANNTNAGVAVKRGRFGKSMFAKKAIHRNTRLFLYWGDVVDADAYSGPLTYAYGTDISGNHAGAVFVEGKGREKEFVRGRKWRRVNGIYINHSCLGHNLRSDWRQCLASGISCFPRAATSRRAKSSSPTTTKASPRRSIGARSTRSSASACPRSAWCSASAAAPPMGPNNFAYDMEEMEGAGQHRL
jgi:hypothetical protein